jgi:hypothetical protein
VLAALTAAANEYRTELLRRATVYAHGQPVTVAHVDRARENLWAPPKLWPTLTTNVSGFVLGGCLSLALTAIVLGQDLTQMQLWLLCGIAVIGSVGLVVGISAR